MGIDTFFNPRSIAVFGAAPGRTGFANLAIRNLKNHHCAVSILPIHPSAAEVDGLAAYKSLDELKSPPDLCIIGVRAELVASVLRDCVRLKVPAVTVVASGYAEQGDEEGRARQQELASIIAGSGTRLVGPNTLGVASYATRVVSIASGNILPAEAMRFGPVAVVSQSGGVALSIVLRAIPKGVGFSHQIALGNELDVGLPEVLTYLADRDEVRVVLCYVEGIRDVEKFRAAIARCAGKGKPVVFMKGGQTQAGQRATASHTGSLAGDGQVWDSVVRQFGAINARSIDHMIALAAIFSRFGPTTASRVGTFCVGGGLTVLLTDMLDKAGIPAPPLAAATASTIKEALPDITPSNPCDMGGLYLSGDGSQMGRAVRAMADDPNVDALVVAYCPVIAEREQVIGGTIAKAGEGVRKPMIVLSYESRFQPESHRWFDEAGMVVIDQPDAGVQAVKSWLGFKPHAAAPKPDASPAAVERRNATRVWMERRAAEGAHTVLEDDAKKILAAYGVPVPAEVVTVTEAEALAAAEKMGYPAALKVLATGMTHRGIGRGVMLDIKNAAELKDAHARLREATQSLSRVKYLVQQMAPSGTEFLIGAFRDPDVGLTLAIAAGGVNAEAINSAHFFALPLDRTHLMKTLSAWHVIRKSREPVNVESLAVVATTIGAFLEDAGDLVAELDVNPVIIDAAGRAMAVDALLILAGGTVSRH